MAYGGSVVYSIWIIILLLLLRSIKLIIRAVVKVIKIVKVIKLYRVLNVAALNKVEGGVVGGGVAALRPNYTPRPNYVYVPKFNKVVNLISMP